MELRQLKQFVVLSETLNFSRAAERLHMAQPALSISIRKLEEEWDVSLFVRDSRGVRLTDAGKAALGDAVKALRYSQSAKSNALAVATGKNLTLRVAFIGSSMHSLLPSLLRRFCARYPDVELQLSEVTSSKILDMVDDGSADVGIVRLPVTFRPTLSFLNLEEDRMVAAMPGDHPLAQAERVSLQQLAQCPFIQFTGEVPGLNSVVSRMFQSAGLAPRVVQHAVQVQTVIGFVESGLGVALVPAACAQKAPQAVVFRPIEDATGLSVTQLALVYRTDDDAMAAQMFRQIADAWVASARAPG